MSKKKNLARELAEELDSLDMMLSSLVEVLERKGILTQDEWEKQIKANIEKSEGKTKYRDIQFAK
jgi:sensor domain CHASE-containing protein